MKYIKMLGIGATAALATAAVAAGSASATTLEVTGVTQNKAVALTASIKAGGSTVWNDTFGFRINSCANSTIKGTTTSPFTNVTRVTAPLSELTTTGCTHDAIGKPIIVHKPGQLMLEHISGTTNALVFLENALWTTWSTIHNTYIACATGAGTLLGTLTGVKHGQATMDINATLNCGPHLSSAKMIGTYAITTEGFGVSA